MEIYFNVDVEYHPLSIALTIALYILMIILFIEGAISFDFKLFVHSVMALQFIH